MESIEFVFIDNFDNPEFSKYNDIFNASRIKEHNDFKPELKYEITIIKFENILYEIIQSEEKSYKLPLSRLPLSRITLNDYRYLKLDIS